MSQETGLFSIKRPREASFIVVQGLLHKSQANLYIYRLWGVFKISLLFHNPRQL